MTKPTISIISAGVMGAGVAAAYTNAGYEITTILTGRSPETLERAKQAQMQDCPNLESLLSDCQIFLSIVPPALATELATQVAEQAKASHLKFTYVECNAISPDHTREIAELFNDSDVKFVDAGIIGGPPLVNRNKPYLPCLYVSGADCQQLNQTAGAAFQIKQLGDEVGRASGMKMSYAAITKGINSLLAGALLTADNLGLLDELLAELESSQNETFIRATTNIQRLPADAGRWAPEMREIAQTFESVGVPNGFHLAAADMMQILDASPFGNETRQTRDTNRTAKQTIQGLIPRK
ncbi:MAG: NAD(P)-dependent oxidoreductase [Alphaproteobacteria bacterium]|nr:NAD(P)-dependent oxidoreductase [Alphaproteobacteria bacterium]